MIPSETGYEHSQKILLLQGKRVTNRAKILNGNGRRRISAIVFDFDGTLAELHLDFIEMKEQVRALARSYLDCAPEPTRMPALEWVNRLAARIHEIDPEASGEFQLRAHTGILELELEAARKGRLFEFTRPLLADLKRDNIRTAIITRNCEQAVRIVFPELDDYCDGFLSREHVPRVKPDPDHLLRALQQISANSASALMVGDHPIDIQTGQSAGVMTAGVCSGNSTREDLARSGAEYTALDCGELLRALRSHKLL